MDIPIAFPVADCKLPELYTLEQKQEALSVAERELETALALAEDFFETREEMDATLHTLRQHPDQPYSKPFMKKITAAILRVNACQQDVEWASESVEDTSLTPAQVKAQVKQMVEAQRVTLERQLEQRMHAERAEWMSQIRQLREELTQQITDRMQLMSQIRQLQEELDEERRHRKAFQSKVKDFSEEVYFVMLYNLQAFKDEASISCAGYRANETIHKIVGRGQGDVDPPIYADMHRLRHNIVFKRAGITDKDYPTDQADSIKDKKGENLYFKQRAAGETFTITTFDGTEK